MPDAIRRPLAMGKSSGLKKKEQSRTSAPKGSKFPTLPRESEGQFVKCVGSQTPLKKF